MNLNQDVFSWKNSSSPVRTPKFKLTAEQPSTGNVGSHPKKDTPHPRAKEKPQQDGRRGKITFRIKPHTRQRRLECSNTPCVHQDPETEPKLCLSVSCRGMGQQWTAAGAGALGAVDLLWHKPTWRRSPLIPPQSRQNLHRTRETDSWRAQTKAWVHQDPGERSSDPTRD